MWGGFHSCCFPVFFQWLGRLKNKETSWAVLCVWSLSAGRVSFRDIQRIPAGNWASPVQVTPQEAFGSCFVGLKMEQEPWKCRVRAQQGCRAEVQRTSGFSHSQEPRSCLESTECRQCPCGHPNRNPALKGSSDTKQGKNVFFYTLETMWKQTQYWWARCCSQTCLEREEREQGAPRRGGNRDFPSLCLCLPGSGLLCIKKGAGAQ